MPIYEYRCDACGHYMDALQKIADEPLRDCPSCGVSALRRLVSAPNFRLKGSGWYETDFKSDKETRRNLVDHPGEARAGKDKDGKAEGDGKSAERGAGKADRESGKGRGQPGKGSDQSGKADSRSARDGRSAERRKPSAKDSRGGSAGGAGPKSRSGSGAGSAAA